jgi:hypothetical protein
MDLDDVSFPALVIADDRWVGHFESKEELSTWRWAAIKRYNKRRLILYDERDRAWQVESIIPRERPKLLPRLVTTLFRSPKLPVRVQVSLISKDSARRVQELLLAAIEADDDILTQWTEADELKEAVRAAASYKDLVGVLKEKRAI